MSKAAEAHNNWKDRFIRVISSKSTPSNLTLAYFTSDKESKEKGHFILTDAKTYYCCEKSSRGPTLFIICENRTWIFAFPTEDQRSSFTGACFDKKPSSVIKEGWLSIPSSQPGSSMFGSVLNRMQTRGAAARQRYFVVLNSGYVVIFKTDTHDGYEDICNLRFTSSIVTSSPVHSIVLTFDPSVMLHAHLQEKVELKKVLTRDLTGLEKKGNKLKRQFSTKDLSNEKRETSEKNYKKYMRRWNRMTAEINEVEIKIATLEEQLTSLKHDKLSIQVWNLLTEEQGGTGYLLGPAAELSSWLLAFEDARDETTQSQPSSHHRTSSSGNSRKTKLRKKTPVIRERRKQHKHIREGSSGMDSNARRGRNRDDFVASDHEETPEGESEGGVVEEKEEEAPLPSGWAETEYRDPKTNEKKKYYFRQASENNTSTTWDRPTVEAESSGVQRGEAEEVEAGAEENVSGNDDDLRRRSRALSQQGKNLLFKSMSIEDDTKEDQQFPSQKCGGSGREATAEANEWSKGKTLRTMLQTIHLISYLVKEPMLSNEKMHDDPDIELAKVQKSYRKTIRLVHPDRTMRRTDVSEYEKLLGSALFTLLKGAMTQ